jgi:toxin ParE1/3/4
MKGEIRRRAGTRQDLVDIFQRSVREAGVGVARRFLAEAEAAFTRLAGMPGMGTRYEADHPAFGELRFFPLSSRFKSDLVFYRPTPEGIEVARVLHGARDIPSILAEEFGLDDGDPHDEAGGETERAVLASQATEPPTA